MTHPFILKSLSVLVLGVFSPAVCGAATLVFGEDFDDLEAGTAITTGNTDFGGASASNGKILAIESTVGTGASLQLTGATASNPPAGAWVGAAGLGSLTTMTMGFSMNLESLGGGRLAFYMGSGNTVSNMGNTNVNDDHFLWDVGVNGATGRLEYRNSTGYVNLGPDTLVLTPGGDYQFLIQVNSTSSDVDGVAAGSMNLYLNGELVASGLGLKGTGSASAFRIGARGATTADGLVAEFDDIRIWNGVQPIPEPGSVALAASGALLMLRRSRR